MLGAPSISGAKAQGYVAYVTTYTIFEKYVRTLTSSILAYVNKSRIRCNYNTVV